MKKREGDIHNKSLGVLTMRLFYFQANKKSLEYQGFLTYRTDGDRTHDPYPVKIMLSR